MADALEARADEFVKVECENTGKPIQLTAEEELPPSVDELRFFAGAARVLEGRSAGEYMKGYPSMVRRERSEERRVGTACVSTCSSRWSRDHKKKKTKNK